MSHDFFKELFEKEKHYQDNLPIISKAGSNFYVSKTKKTQKTDRFFKSIAFSTPNNQNSSEFDYPDFAPKYNQKSNSSSNALINKMNFIKKHKMKNTYSEDFRIPADKSPLRSIYNSDYDKNFEKAELSRKKKARFMFSSLSPKKSGLLVKESQKNLDSGKGNDYIQDKMIEDEPCTYEQIIEKAIEGNDENSKSPDQNEKIKDLLENKPETKEENNLPKEKEGDNQAALDLTQSERAKLINFGLHFIKAHNIPKELVEKMFDLNKGYFAHCAGLIHAFNFYFEFFFLIKRFANAINVSVENINVTIGFQNLLCPVMKK